MVKKNQAGGGGEQKYRRQWETRKREARKAPGKNEPQDNTRKELLKIKIPTKSQQQDPEITVTTEVFLLCDMCETGKLDNI